VAAFNLDTLYGFRYGQGTFGAGSSVDNQYAFSYSSTAGATFNYGFYGAFAGMAAVTITSISGTGSTATVETATAHGLVDGDLVVISGTSVSGYNGGPRAVTIVDTDTFTFASTETASATGGTSTKTNTWNAYMGGTAPNWFGGPTIISTSSNMAGLRITQTGTGNALLVEDSTNPDSTPFVIDASGRVVVGYTSALSVTDISGVSRTPSLQTQGLGGSLSAAYFGSWSNSDAQPSQVIFGKSKSGTVGTNGIVASGTDIGAGYCLFTPQTVVSLTLAVLPAVPMLLQ
jgi:hypothetical protein